MLELFKKTLAIQLPIVLQTIFLANMVGPGAQFVSAVSPPQGAP